MSITAEGGKPVEGVEVGPVVSGVVVAAALSVELAVAEDDGCCDAVEDSEGHGSATADVGVLIGVEVVLAAVVVEVVVVVDCADSHSSLG